MPPNRSVLASLLMQHTHTHTIFCDALHSAYIHFPIYSFLIHISRCVCAVRMASVVARCAGRINRSVNSKQATSAGNVHCKQQVVAAVRTAHHHLPLNSKLFQINE